jgi:hypothetical protein
MGYRDLLLPKAVDMDWSSGPGFSTDVLRTDNGTESRNQNWAGTLARATLRYNARKQAIWEQIDQMFQVCAGRAHSFRVWDPRHNVATAAQGKIIDGQMVLRITVGAYTLDKVITKPDATVVLAGGGTFSTATGEILTGSPTGWSGPFFLCMRFDVDALEIAGINKRGDGTFIAAYNDVPLVEVLDE